MISIEKGWCKNHMMISFVCLLCLCFFGFCSGDIDLKKNITKSHKGNILCLMSLPSKSHHIWNRSIMVSLAEKGYNVTALSVDIDPKPTPNLHYIYMEKIYEYVDIQLKEDGWSLPTSTYGFQKLYYGYLIAASRQCSQSEGYRRLLEYPNDFKFDLVLVDFTALPDILGFVHKFNYPPVVGISAFMTPPNTYDITGNPLLPSLIPFYTTYHSANMNFWQRSQNLVDYVIDYFMRCHTVRKSDVLAKQIFGDDLPFVRDLEKRIEMTLVNSHPGMDVPEVLLPNVIQVGGLQVMQPKPLTQVIDKFFATSRKGAVLFSLGTNVKSVMVGEERLQMFVRAFARLPDYHFLWKIDRTDLKVSKNVMTTQWVSQNDVLGHSKIKLFITHSGLLSTQESTWHGVPMIGIPFFGDQYTNVKKSMNAGVAEKIDIATVTEDEIVTVIKRVLEDPSYQNAMSLRSRNFRDRPRHPLQEAVWWCEYVLRNKGAPHLRSAAAYMNPLVFFMWDLVLVWCSALVLVLLTVYLMLKKLFFSKKIRTTTTDTLRMKKEN